MTDKLTPERRSENMRRIHSVDTSPEIIVRKLAHRMKFRYRLHVGSLPGRPDLVFARLKKIIEVRGCFWHQHTGCTDSHIPKSRVNYWLPKLRKNQERDKENRRRLQSLGWRVLVVWECETKNVNRVAARVRKFLCGSVRLATPEPEVLRVIGEESRRKGTDKLTSRRIDQIIKAVRAQKPKRG